MSSKINRKKGLQRGCRITQKEIAALLQLGSSADRFGLYNFHGSNISDSLSAAVEDSSHNATVLLFGERGIGRTYLLDSISHRLSAGGINVSVLRADLEGYEPDEELSSFLKYKSLKHGSIVGTGFEASLRAENSGSVWTALLAALLCSCPAAERMAWTIILEDPTLWGVGDRDKLFRLIQQLSSDRRVILHLTNIRYIPAPVLEALNAEAEANPNLILVISSSVGELIGPAWADCLKRSKRILLANLTPDELRSVLDRNFMHNAFPERFNQLLWEASRGLPAIAAALTYNFVSSGLICRESNGRWRISNHGVLSELKKGDQYSSNVYSELLTDDNWMSDVSHLLPRFLFLAALCNENIPVLLILEYLGLGGERADQFVDFIDEVLVNRAALFTDLQYGHPSSPTQATYKFSNSLAWRAALEHVPDAERPRLAAGLLCFLKERLPADTVGACVLFLSLAIGSEPTADCDHYRRELAWWVGQAEAEALTEFLDIAVTQNQVSPESIWFTFESTAHRWPAYRRMALLEAYRRHPTRIPKYRKGEVRYVRAQLLRSLGRVQESIEEGHSAVNLLQSEQAQQPVLLTGCYTLIGASYSDLGNRTKALQHFNWAEDVAAEIGNKPEPLLVTILRDLAERFQVFDENEKARTLLEKALDIVRKLYGPRCLQAADLFKSLADVLQKAGDLEGARSYLEQGLELSREIYGNESPQVSISLRILADILRDLGQPRLARCYLEEALEIEIATYGEEDSRVEIPRSCLISLLLELEEFEAARSHLEISLGLLEKQTGSENENVSMLLKYLVDLSSRLGDYKLAHRHLERVILIDEALHGVAHPQVVVQIKLLADVFLKLGDAEGAVACRRRVLNIEEEIYGRKDPRILQNLSCLESVLRTMGETGAVNECLEKRYRIQQPSVG